MSRFVSPSEFVSTTKASSSDAAQPAPLVVQTIEVPINIGNTIVTSAYMLLFLFAITIAAFGIQTATTITQFDTDLVTESLTFGFSGSDADVYDRTWTKIQTRINNKWTDLSAADTKTELLTGLGVANNDHADVFGFKLLYSTYNPINSLHANHDGKKIVEGIMWTMFSLVLLCTVVLLIRDAMTMFREGFSGAHLVSMLCNFFFGAVLCMVLLFLLYTENHLHHSDPADVEHKKGTRQLLFVVISCGIGMGMALLLWLPAVLMPVTTMWKLSSSTYFKYVPSWFVGPDGVDIQGNYNTGVHPLPVLSRIRSMTGFMFALFSSIFLLSLIAYKVKTYHVDGTHPVADAYIDIKTATGIVFLDEAGLELDGITVTASTTAGFLANTLSGSRVHFSGVVTDTLWLVKHHFSGFGYGAMAILVLVCVTQLANWALDGVQIFRAKLKSHDSWNTPVYIALEQRTSQILYTFGSTLLSLAFVLFGYRVTYDFQDNPDQRSPESAEAWLTTAAVFGLTATAIMGYLTSREGMSPVQVNAAPDDDFSGKPDDKTA